MVMLVVAYVLLMLIHLDGYGPFILRAGRSILFGLITVLGFTSQGLPVDAVAVLAICLLHFQTYIINAFYDRQEDKLNGRVLILEPVHLSVTYGFLLQTILWGFYHDARLGCILIALLGLTELYHNPRARLKRNGFMQCTLEGMAAALCFAIGSGFTTGTVLIALSFGLLSNLKDLDDHFGDHGAGNRTLLVHLIVKLGMQNAVAVYKIGYLFVGAAAVTVALAHFYKTPNLTAVHGLILVTVCYLASIFVGLNGERKVFFANGLLLGLIPALSALL